MTSNTKALFGALLVVSIQTFAAFTLADEEKPVEEGQAVELPEGEDDNAPTLRHYDPDHANTEIQPVASMQVPGKSAAQLFGGALDVAFKLAVILGGVIYAFVRKDPNAMQKLLASIPDIWHLVENEKNKGVQKTIVDPMRRALELAAQMAPKELTKLNPNTNQLELKTDELTKKAVLAIEAYNAKTKISPALVLKPVGLPATVVEVKK